MVAPKQEFMARVTEATAAAPYSVTGTPDGFDLRTDLGDDRFLERLRESGVTQAHLHHVAVEGSVYTITSDSRDLSWGVGVPVLASPKDVRKASRGGRPTTAADGSAHAAPAADDALAFEAGRAIITSVGEGLGLTHKQAGRRLEIAVTAAAIILTVAVSFAVAVWVLFLR